MKKIAVIITLGLFALTFGTACNQSKTPKEKAEAVEKELKAERDEWNAKLKDLDYRIDQKISNLREELRDASDDRRAEINSEIRKLEDGKDKVKRDMNRLSGEIKEDWKQVKQEIKEAADDIERAIKD